MGWTRRIIKYCPHCGTKKEIDPIAFGDNPDIGWQKFKCPGCAYIITINAMRWTRRTLKKGHEQMDLFISLAGGREAIPKRIE